MSKSWDSRSGKKLIVFVDRAEIITTVKHKNEETRNPFVIIHISGIKNKQQQKTTTLKHTLSPKWKEVFLFEVPADDPSKKSKKEAEVVLEFMDSGLRDRLIGVCRIPLSCIMEDMMVMTAKRIRDEKCKNTGENANVVGKCQLHLLLSGLSDVPRPLRPGPVLRDNFVFTYKPDMSQFSPGDVILYSTTGPLSALLRVSYGAQWSHCGVVVCVPNKWTSETELCVVEFGSNKDEFCDLYFERPIHNGPMIFRLAERIHAFHGTEAWLLKLRSPLNETNVQSLAKWALSLSHEFYQNVTMKVKDDHNAPIPFIPFTFNQSQTAFFESVGVNVKNQGAYADFYSAQLVSNALGYLHIDVPHQGNMIVQIRDLINSNIFETPFLIRCRPSLKDNPFWPGVQNSATQKPSSSSKRMNTQILQTTYVVSCSADMGGLESSAKPGGGAAADAAPGPQQTMGVETQQRFIGVDTHLPGLLSLIERNEKKGETDSGFLYEDEQKGAAQGAQKEFKLPVPVQQQQFDSLQDDRNSSIGSVDDDIEPGMYDDEATDPEEDDNGVVPEKTVQEEYDADSDEDDGRVIVNSSSSENMKSVESQKQSAESTEDVGRKGDDDEDAPINEDDYDEETDDDNEGSGSNSGSSSGSSGSDSVI